MDFEKQRKKIGKTFGLTEELGHYLTDGEKLVVLQEIVDRLNFSGQPSLMKVGGEWKFVYGDLPF